MQFLIIAQDCFQYDYLINELPRNCTKQFCALYCTKPMMSTKSVRAACKVSLSNWDHIGPPGTSGDHQWLLLTPRDHYGPPMSTRDRERPLRITRDHKHHPSPPTGLPETSRDHRPWPPETTRDNWRQLGFWAIISYCTQLFCAIIVIKQNRFYAVSASLKTIVSCIAPLGTLTFVIYVSFICSITFLSPGSGVIWLKTCW